MVRLPNYVIIGTMKGGTTALHDFICMHPDVEAPTQKEIHYFSLFPNQTKDWYLSHFNCDENKIIGEASPTYFDVAYTQAIPRLIKAYCPNSKLILIVRDPIERAVSHFYHLRNVNKIQSIIDVDINDFFGRPYQTMLKQTTDMDFYLHQVIDFSLYSRKYQSYISVIDMDKILVLDASDLKNSAKETMSKVFAHIGVHDFYDEEFEKVKYSSGRNSSELSVDVVTHLRGLFDDDYASFRRRAGLMDS
jgi:hypothetical protein